MLGRTSSTSVRTLSQRALSFNPRTFHDMIVVLSIGVNSGWGQLCLCDHQHSAARCSTTFAVRCWEQLVEGCDLSLHQVAYEDRLEGFLGR